MEYTTKILKGIDEIKQMKTENKIESKAEKENTEDVKFHELDKASYHISCRMAGWAFSPASQLVTILAGWAFGPAKYGCQNLKVAGHMCPACPRFSSPDQ